VKIQNSFGEELQYTKGVPQGCPLSPIIFDLYIMLGYKDQNWSTVTSGSIEMLLYADDIVILGNDYEEMQAYVLNLENSMRQLGLIFAPTKSEFAGWDFGQSIPSMCQKYIVISKQRIPNQRCFKYLGVTFEIDGLFKQHNELILAKTIERIKAMRTKWLNPKAIRRLVEAILLGMWNYHCIIGTPSDHIIERLRIEIAKFIRASAHLSNRTSKYVLYSQENEGGLGFPDIMARYYALLIIHYIVRLNQEDGNRLMKENYIYTQILENNMTEMGNNKNSLAVQVQTILDRMQLQTASTNNGEIGIKISDGQTDQVLEIAASYWGYRRTKSSKTMHDIVLLEEWVQKRCRDTLQKTKDDWIGQYIDRCHSSTIRIPCAKTSYGQRLLIQARTGALMTDQHHPSFCYYCRQIKSVRHSILECRGCRTELNELKDSVQLLKGIPSDIKIEWESEFNEDQYQMSTRGVTNNKLGKTISKKNREAIQKLCGQYLIKITQKNDFQVNRKRQREQEMILGSADLTSKCRILQ